MTDLSSHTHSNGRARWLIFAGVMAAFFVALAGRLRAVAKPAPVVEPVAVPIPATAAPISYGVAPLEPASEPAADETDGEADAESAPARGLIFVAALLALAAVLIGLQNSVEGLSALIFVLVVAGSLGYALWRWSSAHPITLPALPAGTARVNAAAQRAGAWLALPARGLAAAVTANAQRLAGLLGVSALVLLALSAISFQVARSPHRTLDEPIFLMLAGTAALWVGLALNRLWGAGDLPLPGVRAPEARLVPTIRLTRRGQIIAGLGIAALAVVAEVNGDLLHNGHIQFVSHHTQFILLCIGLALVIWGIGRDGLLPRPAQVAAFFRKPGLGWEIAAVLTIAALALALRWIGLGTTIRSMVDEVNTIAEMIVFPGSNVPLLTQMSGISPFPWMFAYFQRLGIDVLGGSIEGIRAASSVTGMLTVLALYGLARALFDRRTALVAGLLLASFPPHLQFSRLALLNIADPLVGTLGLAFLGRGMLSGRRMDYVLAGLFLALTQYFYNGGRMFYIPLAAVWVVAILLLNLRAQADPGGQSIYQPNANILRGLRVMGITLLIAFMPVGYTMLAQSYPLIGRMEASGLSADYWRDLIARGDYAAYLHRLGYAMRFYIQIPDDTLYYGGDTPLVLPLLVPVFLLGLGYCLWRWRAPGPLLVVLWLATGALGSSIMIMSAASTRFVIVFPAIALALAIGLRYTLALIWPPRIPALALRLGVGARRTLRFRWPPRWPERHRALLTGGLVVAMAAFQINYYFGPHLEYYNLQFRYKQTYPDGFDAILRSVHFPPGTQIHIISDPPFSEMDGQALLTLTTTDLVLFTRTPQAFNEAYIEQMRCGVDHAFFILQTDILTLARLEYYFFLRPPEYSPYAYTIPPDKHLALYYAPYIRGSESIFGNRCQR